MTPAAALAPVTPVLTHLAAPCVGQAVKGFLLLRIQAGVKAARRLVTSFGVFLVAGAHLGLPVQAL